MLLVNWLFCTLTCAPSHTSMAPPQPLVVFSVVLSWKLQLLIVVTAGEKRG